MTKRAKQKWYVVWKGRCPGIFPDWASCKLQTDGFPGARFKSFDKIEDATAAFQAGGANSKSSRTTSPRQSPIAHKQFDFEDVSADVIVFTDGACNPNPGESGSGAAVYTRGVLTSLWYGRYHPKGTNNTAELAALHYGLVVAGEAIERGMKAAVCADSLYAIKCITLWAASWKKNGWRRKKGEVENLEQIQEIFAVYEKLKGAVPVYHVRGHAGIEGNELADRMSLLAVEELETGWRRYPDPIIVDDILTSVVGAKGKLY